MSKFYGQIKGDKGAATRGGHHSITSSVQSHNGSIQTQLTYKDEQLMVDVSISRESSAYGSTIFYGTFEEFIAKLKA